MSPRPLTFSERMGITPVRESVQIDGMDSRLRVAVFNYIHDLFCEYWERGGVSFDSAAMGESLAWAIWCNLYYQTADEFPCYPDGFLTFLKGKVCEGEWNSVYDLLEYIVQETQSWQLDVAGDLNAILEDEYSGFRFAEEMLVPICNEVELRSLEESLGVSDAYSGARKHIQTATELFSNRDNPDYRNVVKEAISAVESAVSALVPNSGKARFGELINRLEKQSSIHPALAKAWKEMYGFTSDESGIRHALSDESSTVDFKMARYMLVSCSAFVNYLVQSDVEALEGADHGIQI